MIVQTALLIGLVLFSVLAILLKDLLRSAISLAVASLLLGIIFFRLNAPYAGVFEISVVAGLITVLFMLFASSGISCPSLLTAASASNARAHGRIVNSLHQNRSWLPASFTIHFPFHPDAHR